MMRPQRALHHRHGRRAREAESGEVDRDHACQSSSFIRISRLSRVMPALLTRMSSLPPRASTAAAPAFDRGARKGCTAARRDRRQGSRESFSSSLALLPDSANCAPCAAAPWRSPAEPAARPGHQRGLSGRSNIIDLLRQRFNVLDRDDARHLGVGRDALDHRAEHLAAQFDELVDARLGHFRDAFAPADHARHLVDEQRADGIRIGYRPRALTLAYTGTAGSSTTT